MATHCDRCGKDCRYKIHSDFVMPTDLMSLMNSYSIYGVKYLCKECGRKADDCLRYYGVKKKEDIYKLMCYLQSGPVSSIKVMKTYSALMNGGYYEDTSII